MLFYNTKTSEEASYVGEMARGADSIVASRASCCHLIPNAEAKRNDSSSTTDLDA